MGRASRHIVLNILNRYCIFQARSFLSEIASLPVEKAKTNGLVYNIMLIGGAIISEDFKIINS